MLRRQRPRPFAEHSPLRVHPRFVWGSRKLQKTAGFLCSAQRPKTFKKNVEGTMIEVGSTIGAKIITRTTFIAGELIWQLHTSVTQLYLSRN